MRKIVVASSMNPTHDSAVSMDYIGEPSVYGLRNIEDAIEKVFNNFGYECLGVDFTEVDYSGYPEYADEQVGQVGADFRWSESYPESELRQALEDAIYEVGYLVIGTSFYSLEG